jgi:hypothetical protein
MGIHVGEHRRQRILQHFGIRVQEEDVTTLCQRQALVVAAREAAILRQGDHFHFGIITREQLQRSKLFAEALQSRINALTTDFVNRDDPYQRAQIAQQRQEALAELDRVTRDIDNYSKAVDDLQEEARRAGVPPGWVR